MGLGHPRLAERTDRTGGDRGGTLRWDTEDLAHLPDRARRVLVVVEVEQVLAAVLRDDLAPPDAVGDAQVHPGRLDDALGDVAIEETGGRDVAGLEEAGERGQPREALRIGISAADEREDLQLTLEVGAVVGEHVDEVVLRQVLRRATRRAGELEAPAVVHVPHAEPERVPVEVLERGPARRQRGILLGGHERGACAARGWGGALAGVRDVLDEAAALQVLPRQPVRALRVPARHAHEVVLHPEGLGVHRDAMGHDGRDRSQHQLAEHHVVDDPLPVVEVAFGQDFGQLLAAQRFERAVVDRDAGERGRDGLEEISLHVGEPGLRRHRRRDPAGDETHLVDIVDLDTGSGNRVQGEEPFRRSGWRA